MPKNGKRPGPGQPTKYTPELRQRILEEVRTGMPLKHAVACAGITYQTLYNWEKEDPFFAQEIEIARLASVKERWEKIKQAAEDRVDKNGNVAKLGDWHSLAWQLERSFPETFSRPEFQMINQTNVQHNHFTISVEGAEAVEGAVRELEVETGDLFSGRLTEGGSDAS